MFKAVVERGRWTKMFTEADKLYKSSDIDNALILFFIAAELGVEVAESNVAFILEQGACLRYSYRLKNLLSSFQTNRR